MRPDREQAKQTFEQSLTRCLSAGDFIGTFYQRFIASSEQVREKFSNTDLARQKQVLKQSLHLMALASLRENDGLEHLEKIAHSHSKRHLDISPSLYEIWLEVLTATARDFDPEFSDAVEISWRGVLRPGIDRMVEVYRKEHTVRPRRT